MTKTGSQSGSICRFKTPFSNSRSTDCRFYNAWQVKRNEHERAETARLAGEQERMSVDARLIRGCADDRAIR